MKKHYSIAKYKVLLSLVLLPIWGLSLSALLFSLGPGCRLSQKTASEPYLCSVALPKEAYTGAILRFCAARPAPNNLKESRIRIGDTYHNVLMLPKQLKGQRVALDSDGATHLNGLLDDSVIDNQAEGLILLPKVWESQDPLAQKKTLPPFFFPLTPQARNEADQISIPIIRPSNQPQQCQITCWEALPYPQHRIVEEVSIPFNATFESNLGIAALAPAQGTVSFRFIVRVQLETESHLLIDKRLEPDASGNALEQVSADLSRFGGMQASFHFEIHRDKRSAFTKALVSMPVFADPILRSPPAQALPNILLISLDTLRADHLGCYGYARKTSPAIDRFAKEATLFEQAIALSTWTTPSHASIFTGLPALEHNAGIYACGFRLKDKYHTLAEYLRPHGYRTVAFTEGGSVGAQLGFAQGFESYSNGPDGNGQHVEKTFQRASEWIAGHKENPFFMFLHTFEIHEPFSPPTAYLKEFADPDYNGAAGPWLRDAKNDADKQHCRDSYDGEIAYTDAILGQLFDRLKAEGLWDSTIIILLSDHGEEFWEHGDWGHVSQIYDEVIHVPLLLHIPGITEAGLRVQEQVATSDLFATILELLKLENPHPEHSHSLLPLLPRAKSERSYSRQGVESVLVSHLPKVRKEKGLLYEWMKISFRSPEEKTIFSNKAWLQEMAEEGKSPPPWPPGQIRNFTGQYYLLQEDPLEKQNLISDSPKMEAEKKKDFQFFLEQINKEAPPDNAENALEDENRDKMEALGYL